jgi:hypothetical protein
MPELERELQALAPMLDWPDEPALGPRVRTRLGKPPRPARRRWLVLALAVLAAAVAAAFAVPQSRGTILRWLGLGSVRIEFVDRLPNVRPGQPLELGERLSLAEAGRRAGFRVLTSPLLGAPDAVFYDGVEVALLYGTPSHVRLLVNEIHATERPELFKKLAGEGTKVSPVSVAGEPGYWISGASHVLVVAPSGAIVDERVRLAGDTLLWLRGGLTLRLEGDLTRERALAVAESFR